MKKRLYLEFYVSILADADRFGFRYICQSQYIYRENSTKSNSYHMVTYHSEVCLSLIDLISYFFGEISKGLI